MPKYVMSRKERKEAIPALEAAKAKLWDGTGSEYENGNTEFICIAIERTNTDSRIIENTRELIDRSIFPHSTYDAWLHSNFPQYNYEDTRMIQSERLRFVNHLIKALKRSVR